MFNLQPDALDVLDCGDNCLAKRVCFPLEVDIGRTVAHAEQRIVAHLLEDLFGNVVGEWDVPAKDERKRVCGHVMNFTNQYADSYPLFASIGPRAPRDR
jgi:hypothetical protein